MKHENQYVWLDLARGVSALLVCAGHLRGAIFIDYSSLSEANLFHKLFYFTTGLGHQAVMIFFVLSGFFVGGSVIKRGNDFQLKTYYIARLSRLWVVLIPALAFTLLVDQAINVISPEVLAGYYYSTLSSGPKDGNYSASFNTFVANILFLQNIYSPIFGSNGPLWSLANEFWYYVLFPLIYIASNKDYMLPARSLSFFLVIVIIFTTANSLLEGFLIWLLGVGVYWTYAHLKIRHHSWYAWLAGFIFIISLVDSKLLVIGRYADISSDLMIGISFSFLLIGIKNMSLPRGWECFARASKGLSEISYTLYLMHFPITLLVFASFYRQGQLRVDSLGIVQYIGWLLVLLSIAYGMWWLFERNTQRFRLYLQQHLVND